MEYSDNKIDSDMEMIDDLFNDEEYDEDNKEEQNDSEKVQEKQEEKAAEKKLKDPKIVRSSRVTLNYYTLKGNNGLSALKKLFENFKFKGNGHEKEDLMRIMGILQQWMCYKLCPSYDFESCMLQLEALGKKRINQVLIKKYRLGMDEWGESKNDEIIAENNIEIEEESNKNDFDSLLAEELANVRSEDEFVQNEEMQTESENQQVTQMDVEVTLTSEQLERIARNKKLAEERRFKRMSERQEMTSVNQENEKMGDQDIPLENISLEEKS